MLLSGLVEWSPHVPAAVLGHMLTSAGARELGGGEWGGSQFNKAAIMVML